MTAGIALIGDVGGTYCRFALARPGEAAMTVVERRCDDFASFDAALDDALAELAEPPRLAALALAGPVAGDTVRLTNRAWTVCGGDLARRIGLSACHLVNDFAAVAWSLPLLAEADVEAFGDGEPALRGGGPMVVLGPGTGLGVAAALPAAGGGWQIVAGEGGHVSFAPADHFEASLLAQLWRERRQVSREDLLCGHGLVRLHRAMAALAGAEPASDDPAAIVELARDDPDGLPAQTVRAFCRMLGGYAGDLALIFAATGGVFLAGGVVRRLGGLFDAAGFRERFTLKPPHQGLLQPVPTFHIVHPYPALLGLSAFLAAHP